MRAGGFVVMLTRELGNVPTLVREWNPALLLLNVAAERDASEAFNRLRMNGRGVSVPTVACVSVVMPGDEATLLAQGMSAYFRRPVTPRQVMRILRILPTAGDPA